MCIYSIYKYTVNTIHCISKQEKHTLNTCNVHRMKLQLCLSCHSYKPGKLSNKIWLKNLNTDIFRRHQNKPWLHCCRN